MSTTVKSHGLPDLGHNFHPYFHGNFLIPHPTPTTPKPKVYSYHVLKEADVAEPPKPEIVLHSGEEAESSPTPATTPTPRAPTTPRHFVSGSTSKPNQVIVKQLGHQYTIPIGIISTSSVSPATVNEDEDEDEEETNQLNFEYTLLEAPIPDTPKTRLKPGEVKELPIKTGLQFVRKHSANDFSVYSHEDEDAEPPKGDNNFGVLYRKATDKVEFVYEKEKDHDHEKEFPDHGHEADHDHDVESVQFTDDELEMMETLEKAKRFIRFEEQDEDESKSKNIVFPNDDESNDIEWTPKDIFEDESVCLHPAPIPNGEIACHGLRNDRNEFLAGSATCHVACDPGFATVGSELARCGANGAWLSDSPLACDPAVAVVIGGWNRNSSLLDHVEVFDGDACNMEIARLPSPRRGMTAAWIGGEILVCGGFNDTESLNRCWSYNAEKDEWKEKNDLKPIQERHFAASTKAQAQLFVLGGRDGRERPMALGTAESLFDGKWREEPGLALSQERAYHCATSLNDDTLVITGGYSYNAVVGVTEAFNLTESRATWRDLGNLREARYLHGCSPILLPTGQTGLLVAGGFGTEYLATAELYDPNRGSWNYTGSLSKPRQGGQMAVFAGGRPVILGGFHNSHVFPRSVEQFIVEEGRWRTLDKGLRVPRRYFAMAMAPRSLFSKCNKL